VFGKEVTMGANHSKSCFLPLTAAERAKAEKRAINLLATTDMTMGLIGKRVGLLQTEISDLNKREKVRIFGNQNNTSWTLGPKWKRSD